MLEVELRDGGVLLGGGRAGEGSNGGVDGGGLELLGVRASVGALDGSGGTVNKGVAELLAELLLGKNKVVELLDHVVADLTLKTVLSAGHDVLDDLLLGVEEALDVVVDGELALVGLEGGLDGVDLGRLELGSLGLDGVLHLVEHLGDEGATTGVDGTAEDHPEGEDLGLTIDVVKTREGGKGEATNGEGHEAGGVIELVLLDERRGERGLLVLSGAGAVKVADAGNLGALGESAAQGPGSLCCECAKHDLVVTNVSPVQRFLYSYKKGIDVKAPPNFK